MSREGQCSLQAPCRSTRPRPIPPWVVASGSGLIGSPAESPAACRTPAPAAAPPAALEPKEPGHVRRPDAAFALLLVGAAAPAPLPARRMGVGPDARAEAEGTAGRRRA